MSGMSKAKRNECTTPPTCSAFVDGVVWAAQFVAVDHRHGSCAEDMMRTSGFTRAELMKAQRRSGYESRTMCALIRRATPNIG